MIDDSILALQLFMNIIIERVSVELHVLFRDQALEEAAHIR